MTGTLLREKLSTGRIIAAPGIYDMMSLLLANRQEFDAHYASGYWGTASALGLPDVGIAGYRDFITQFGRFAETSTAPLIADADTGFGSIANLVHAVKGYARAGVAAMQLEDQGFPKICGHVGRAVSVADDQMVTRIHAALEARETVDRGKDMLIIARSDARRTEGLDRAIDRLKKYADAGADILFLEAPEDEKEIEQAANALSKPLMVNAAHGGFTPILSPNDYAALGARLVIYPAGAPLSAAAAVQNFYAQLKEGNPNSTHDAMFDFAEMSEMLGIDDVGQLQDKYPNA
ncbi:MAG: isocitrate lyase/PEP mutase family protein [Parasphingorhabdus sp.]|uniref:isocitrate lyase/PEP mutase family protein n=1 Tax=Parasphingorhabdus sp. TaxID=2709688 RepID=UPI00329772B9